MDLSYSLVMTAFQGRYGDFQGTAAAAFGRRGLDVFSLCLGGDQYLPAEIAAGLTAADAARVTSVLEAAGATLQVVPTDQVTGVRYRAAECWPTHQGRGWCFTEVDGMVLSLAPLNARHNLAYLRERQPGVPRWQLERSLNHQHPTHESSREGLRAAREFGEKLAAALREAYPGRGFVLSYLEEQVSFYQRGEGPESSLPWSTPLRETLYCEACRQRQRYRRRKEPDPEFPDAEWGDCAGCGGELLLRTAETLACL